MIPFVHETNSSYFERVERLKAQVTRAEEAAQFVGDVCVKGRAVFRTLARLLKPANDDDAGRHAA